MFSFTKVQEAHIQKECRLHNSNPAYNKIAYDKQLLTVDDIREQWKEADELGNERHLVGYGESFIGIIEYGMQSPNSGNPWLSLLLIDSTYHGQGLGKKVYRVYEELMKKRQADVIEMAVHADNFPAVTFWTSLGFLKYRERIYEKKRMYSYHKPLLGGGEETEYE
ncbi:GNAT family N-acetyltransferase [Halobacillus kuroshimensis]|uniref:GNAT family N-acetyltransferase n=1 Tax=Halobacillus kuroshimensis TaxID=302481 RepID=A0ABS3DRM8_9BACI|nr:GNAT family N-acetyltransferase [Halobacillus kuroshimensis]MBN8234000.1 GNAT family N-acetyltransferase [Halobacillus kuroshimensis]